MGNKAIETMGNKAIETSIAQTIPFKLCIAIDFGTDGIGLAYAIDDKVLIHDNFRSRIYGYCTKQKSIVLLDQNGEMISFGSDAKAALSEHIHHPMSIISAFTMDAKGIGARININGCFLNDLKCRYMVCQQYK